MEMRAIGELQVLELEIMHKQGMSSAIPHPRAHFS